jgi:hypothetical protein
MVSLNFEFTNANVVCFIEIYNVMVFLETG